MPVDELSHRKAERHEPSLPICFADGTDGQVWMLPAPSWFYRCRFKDGKAVGAYPWFGYGSHYEFDQADEIVQAIGAVDDPAATFSLVATLAAAVGAAQMETFF